MKVQFLGLRGSWRDVADASRTTIGMEPGTGEPSSRWKKKILLAEHSPIRLIHIKWKWLGLKYWISVHFVRHKFGVEHFVRTQRTDRNPSVNRDEAPQSALINHECEANAQAIINISRKRLCRKSNPETRKAWIAFLESIKHIEPELYSVCVPECIYRGFCPEIDSCGWVDNNKEVFEEMLRKYRTK